MKQHVLLLAGITLAIIFIIGVGGHDAFLATTSSNADIALQLVVDSSGSFCNQRDLAVQSLCDVARNVNGEGRTYLNAWRFDSSVASIFDGPTPTSGQRLGEILDPQLIYQSAAGGTRLDLMLEGLADQAERAHGIVPIAITFDGFADGMPNDGEERIRKSVKRLAKLPNVVVVAFAGVAISQQPYLRSLCVTLGDRLKFATFDELPKTVVRSIEAARAGGRK